MICGIHNHKEVIANLKKELEMLRQEVMEPEFNSEFNHRMGIVKCRFEQFNQKIARATKEIEEQANTLRRAINDAEKEFWNERTDLLDELMELRLLRLERSRQNYAHIIELKRSAMEEAARMEAEKGAIQEGGEK